MDLTPTTTSYGADSKEWLGSAHGTTTAEAITLDPALMLAVFEDGDIPSGVVLGKVTATGRYGPYDDAAVDGRAVARGHLFDGVKVAAGHNIGAALLWHGQVIEAKLPADHGLDANGKGDLKHIHYV